MTHDEALENDVADGLVDIAELFARLAARGEGEPGGLRSSGEAITSELDVPGGFEGLQRLRQKRGVCSDCAGADPILGAGVLALRFIFVGEDEIIPFEVVEPLLPADGTKWRGAGKVEADTRAAIIDAHRRCRTTRCLFAGGRFCFAAVRPTSDELLVSRDKGSVANSRGHRLRYPR